jgi:hypothetical protein
MSDFVKVHRIPNRDHPDIDWQRIAHSENLRVNQLLSMLAEPKPAMHQVWHLPDDVASEDDKVSFIVTTCDADIAFLLDPAAAEYRFIGEFVPSLRFPGYFFQEDEDPEESMCL